MQEVIGWDIGGVNTKVARVSGGVVQAVRARPYELQRDPLVLGPLLQTLAAEVGAAATAAHAVTMTAELSQMFRTKREGVGFVLDAVESAFPNAVVRVYTVDGRLLTPAAARREPLAVAAANWSAAAHAVAHHHPDALWIDIGTTTTDIIPIVGGAVVAVGRTDPERLASGELVYTGALRTPAEAIAGRVLLGGEMVGVSAEGFALAGDVHLWSGDLIAADYTVATPDGRPATAEFAGERLARVVCADRDMLDHAAISAIADALAAAQVSRIADDVSRVIARHPSLAVAVVTGLGAFIGDAAARRSGLRVVPLAPEMGEAAARCTPAASVALLLDRLLTAPHRSPVQPIEDAAAGPVGSDLVSMRPLTSAGEIDDPLAAVEQVVEAAVATPLEIVVKLGGGMLANADGFDAVLTAVGAAARRHALLVVPGGGPFADAVRGVDRRFNLSNDVAHWMALLAMDQYAQLVAARLVNGAVVATPREIGTALAAGRVPVLAPSRWLRAVDPLPHSWEVTSDSIAAWVAGQVGAPRLVVVKPSGAVGDPHDLLDEYFAHALPATVAVVVIAADQVAALSTALDG